MHPPPGLWEWRPPSSLRGGTHGPLHVGCVCNDNGGQWGGCQEHATFLPPSSAAWGRKEVRSFLVPLRVIYFHGMDTSPLRIPQARTHPPPPHTQDEVSAPQPRCLESMEEAGGTELATPALPPVPPPPVCHLQDDLLSLSEPPGPQAPRDLEALRAGAGGSAGCLLTDSQKVSPS